MSRYILLWAGLVVPVKTRERKNSFFCGFFTVKAPWKIHLRGQTSDFHASCGKISMLNFQKIMWLLTFARSHNYTKIWHCQITHQLCNSELPETSLRIFPKERRDGVFIWSFAPKAGANSTGRANQRLFSFREHSTWMTQSEKTENPEKQNLIAAYSTSPWVNTK